MALANFVTVKFAGALPPLILHRNFASKGAPYVSPSQEVAKTLLTDFCYTYPSFGQRTAETLLSCCTPP